jgi:hypothetical protein
MASPRLSLARSPPLCLQRPQLPFVLRLQSTRPSPHRLRRHTTLPLRLSSLSMVPPYPRNLAPSLLPRPQELQMPCTHRMQFIRLLSHRLPRRTMLFHRLRLHTTAPHHPHRLTTLPCRPPNLPQLWHPPMPLLHQSLAPASRICLQALSTPCLRHLLQPTLLRDPALCTRSALQLHRPRT